jgi:hypothetical protein
MSAPAVARLPPRCLFLNSRSLLGWLCRPVREDMAVSKYIEFFAAPSDAAAAAVRNMGPARRYAFVDANDIYFDADDAVIAWRNLLAGRTNLYLSEQDDLHMVADFVNDATRCSPCRRNLSPI